MRRSSRRAFLTGRAAVDAVEDLADSLEFDDGLADQPPEEKPSPGRVSTSRIVSDRTILQLSRRAMACEFQILLSGQDQATAGEAALAAFDLIDRLEDQLTVYRDHSEVSRLNRTAHERPVQVEQRLFRLLEQALKLYELTGGAFDITAGPLSEIWGFSRREGRLAGSEEIAAALQRVGSRWLLLDPAEKTVRFRREGLGINLGGIGKGYALDRAAEQLRVEGAENFLIHGGQSSVLARGGSDADSGWTVGVGHPLRPDRRLAEITLRDMALSTSGSRTQSFTHRGRRFGHVLDPRTGQPVEGVYSATVVAPTAAESDALSTAFFVLGPEQAAEICSGRDDLAMFLVTAGPLPDSIQTHINAPADWEWIELESGE